MTVNEYINNYAGYMLYAQRELLRASAEYYKTYLENLVRDNDTGQLKDIYELKYLDDFGDLGDSNEGDSGPYYKVYALKGSTEEYYYTEAMINIQEASGGVSGNPEKGVLTLNLPPFGVEGNTIIPVGEVAGYQNTFMTYDTSVAVAHETSHLILGFLGMHTGAGQELPVAALAAIGREATGDIATYLREYFGLDKVSYGDTAYSVNSMYTNKVEDMLNKARTGDGSYENIYNRDILKLYENSGLSEAPSTYREGYISHYGNGEADFHTEWKTYGAGETNVHTLGRRDNLSFRGVGIAWLGNQYDNTMQIGTYENSYDSFYDGGASDYIDGGKGGDTIGGGYGSDKLIGGAGDDFIYAQTQNGHDETSKNTLVGGALTDIVGSYSDNDLIYGADGDDTIYGDNADGTGSGIDEIYGYKGKDFIVAGKGVDSVFGGDDDDIIVGGSIDVYAGKIVDDNETDTLDGGEGFDTYYVGDGDSIVDSDLTGKIIFQGYDLTGVKTKNKETGRYQDTNGFEYEEAGNTLHVRMGEEGITIEGWDSEEHKGLGIELSNKVTVTIGDSEAVEKSEEMVYTISLSRELSEDEQLTLDVEGEELVFNAGESSKNYKYKWIDDEQEESDEEVTIKASVVEYTGGEVEDVEIVNGNGRIIDDDVERRHDPLAIDTNKDGVISTTSLDDSVTYFDLTGDGLKEKVGWIKSEDALLVYDRNENGLVDGIDEVFGNQDENGFEELKRVADSNYDNVVDRRDELFNQLQVWNDHNQDALVQVGELRTLQEADIQAIELDYVSTDIDLNGNRLTEASRYSDGSGDRLLAADIQLLADLKDTRVELDDLSDLEIEESTRTLPLFKGSGLVYDSLIQYNLDPEFKALTEYLASDFLGLAKGVEEYLESYSGYQAYVNGVEERYSVANFEMHDIDKHQWIYDRFQGITDNSELIEKAYESKLNNGQTQNTPVIENEKANENYQFLLNQYESGFALQSIFKTQLNSIEFNWELNQCDVVDSNALNLDVISYLSNESHSDGERIYLAHVLSHRLSELDLDINSILESINDSNLQLLIQRALQGKAISYLDNNDDVQANVLIGTSGKDYIKIDHVYGDQVISLNEGDDKLVSLEGNQTYLYDIGDGFDTIGDISGVDKLVFGEGITRDDVEVRLQRNADLVIALKEEGKSFDLLTDKVLLVDWIRPENRIEAIEFYDGTLLNPQDVFEQLQLTDGVDVVELSSFDDIIDSQGGHDVLKGAGGNDQLTGAEGNDRLEGGSGNDTYFYGRGHGKDTIIDSSGHDTLQFLSGIAEDDLVLKVVGLDLFVGLKEEGKSFDQLSDVITIKNYGTNSNLVEAVFLEGYIPVDLQGILNRPTNGDDELSFIGEGVSVDLLSGDDVVDTGHGSDSVYGNEGNDFIRTNDGDDHLEGGTGNDILYGGKGNDTYVFNRGDGKDVILDDYSFGTGGSRQEDAGFDTLIFGEGILEDDILFEYEATNLLIGIKTGNQSFAELTDVVTIQNFLNTKNSIEKIILSNGSEISIPSVPIVATVSDASDKVHFEGVTEDIRIDALEGNDFVHTGSGDDQLNGSIGNDDLYGGAGNDLLIGGSGSDFLLGGAGNDTYFFEKGDLNSQGDIILDDNRHEYYNDEAGRYGYLWFTSQKILSSATPQTNGGTDAIRFGEGIRADDISFSRKYGASIGGFGFFNPGSNDLIVNVADGKLIIREFFNPFNSIEHMYLADGTEIELPKDKYSPSLNGYEQNGNVITEHDDNYVVRDMATLQSMHGTYDLLGGDDFFESKRIHSNENISGGLGNDTLLGGTGNDSYFFNKGDGQDTIIENGGSNSLVFGDGVSFEDIVSKIDGSDLIIAISEDGKSFDELADQITLSGYLKGHSDVFSEIKFSDGTVLNPVDLIKGTDFNDSFIIDGSFNNINLLAGDDYLEASGDVYVNGGDGSDTIDVVNGSNTIVGGTGNDQLLGGYHSDTYVFSIGDGLDIIQDSGGGVDTVRFGEGITLDSLQFKVSETDLIIGLSEENMSFDDLSDKITIKNFIGFGTIEFLEFVDGNKISLEEFVKATESDDNFNFGNYQQVEIDLLAGDDSVTTGPGRDIIWGNAGNDTIISGAGSDQITGGVGDDYLVGGKGNDRYYFSIGDGKDVIKDTDGFSDTIVLDDISSLDKLALKKSGDDLIIGVKEVGKVFEEFSDTISIKNWFLKSTNIERLQLSDGSIVDAAELASILQNSIPDILLSKNGAEMYGGLGDDTYVYKKGDFTVIINDQYKENEIDFDAGNDVLEFKDINFEQVEIGVQDENLVIKIDVQHDTYTELKDYVVIRNWKDANRGIESISFANGELLEINKNARYPQLEFDENWIASRYYIYGAEDNYIEGTEFSEVIEAGKGDDTIVAGTENDRLIGQEGNDFLQGGDGNDVYVFNRGDGQDVVFDTSGVDTLVFSGGISSDEIIFEQVSNDLIVALDEDGKEFSELANKVTLTDWFTGVESRVEYLAFDSQDVISIADLLIEPTEGDDNLEYGDENNRIDALGGDDIIHMGGGNDELAGNDGDDLLYAGSGDDTISGDTGIDTLYGAEGDDTYLFGRGDGSDTIIEDNFYDWGSTGSDTLKFKEGISQEDIILVQQGEDLVVGLFEEGKGFNELADKVTLKKWSTYDQENSRDYSRAYYAVEQFSFADGSTWNMSQIISRIHTDTDDVIYGFNGHDVLTSASGNDELHGRLGDDTYVFNRGDGHDTIFDQGQKGSDTSYYDAGNDTLQFGHGITEGDLIFTLDESLSNLRIYINEEGKELSELQDGITIIDWVKANSRVENFKLEDCTVLNISDYLSFEPTEGSDVLIYGNDADYIDALAGNDIVFARGGNDTILGNAGNDELQGEAGNDTLIGGTGDDILDGGVGDDRLDGGAGSDLYLFNLGDGHDVITDLSTEVSEFDTIRLGLGIANEDIDWTRRENDLYIEINEDNSIKVENWFVDNAYRIEAVEFADDSVLDVNQIESQVVFLGDENDNNMSGSENGSTILGLEGDDTIFGNGGDDIIDGGAGNDTYLFNWGDGHDIITDSSGLDAIQFAAGITNNDLYFKDAGDQWLIALFEEGKDFDTFSNTLTINKADIEKVIFENGNQIDVTAINLANSVNDEILELDQVATVYQGSLNEDSSSTPHFFKVLTDSITIDSTDVSDLSISIVDIATGEFKVDGNFDGLSAGELANISFKYEVNYDSDDTALLSGIKEMNLVVTGTNDIPEITGVLAGEIIEGSVNEVSGSLTINDLDYGESLIQAQTEVSGDYGVFNISEDGVWTYQLSGGIPDDVFATEVFTITSLDGSASKDINISVTSSSESNTPPEMVPQISEQRINVNPSQSAGAPNLISLENGSFAVSWDDYNYSYYGGQEVYSQLYSSDGKKTGAENLVNTFSDGNQYVKDMVTLNNGNYIVIWESYGQGSMPEVYLQQFNSIGEKVGAETQVNTYVDDPQPSKLSQPTQPTIAVLNNGYVVAWQTYDQDGDSYGIYLQQFSNEGEKVGSETSVNTYTASNQRSAVIASLENGGYVVGWDSYGQDGSGSGAYLQVFDSLGNKVGQETRISNDADGNQYFGEFASLLDGGFAVSFIGDDGGTNHFHVKKYDGNGVPVGQEQVFSSSVELYGSKPQLVQASDGGFFVSWVALKNDGNSDGVFLQRHDAQGDKVGNEVKISDSESLKHSLVDVTLLADGDYVVTWESTDSYYGGANDVYIQKFNSDGVEIGSEQQVNLNNKAYPGGIDVTALQDGGFVVAYEDISGPDKEGVRLQRFDTDGQKLGEATAPKTGFSLLSYESLKGNLDYIQDSDGDNLSFSASVTNGEFVIDENGNWSYKPVQFSSGTEEATIIVSDGKGGNLEHKLIFNVESGMVATPLVLDLNDNGITSVSIESSNAYFDYDGDGNREHTAWQERGDAQLVADLNFDGQINDGSEIFGDYTLLPDGTRAKDGYEALEHYDSNGDRIIDRHDDLFGNLSLWHDHNQNGKTEVGELINIQLSQVESINLDRESGITFEQRLENGNIILNETSYKGVDGSSGIIRDVGFVYNAIDTITNNDTLSIQFYGQSLSGEDGDDTYVFNNGDGVVTINDNGDGADTLAFGEGISADQLIVRWDKPNNGLVIGIKDSADDDSSIYDVSDKIQIIDWFEESGSIESFEFADGTSLSRESLYEQYTSLAESQGLNTRVLDADGELAGGEFADVLYGAEGEEKLEGLAGNDFLRGLDGDDYLLAGSGNDTLVGGLGDDTLYSQSGDDYYLYNKGDGKDLIQDFAGFDRIVFGADVKNEDLIIEADGYDLLIGIREEGKPIEEFSDLIRIEGHYIPGFQIEQIELSSGEVIALPINDLLEIQSVDVSLLEDTSFTGQVELEGYADGAVFEIITNSDSAEFTIDADGNFVYTPNENFFGQDSVTIQVTNSKGQVDTEEFFFNVENVNDAVNLINGDQSFDLVNTRDVSGVVEAEDVDGDVLTFSVDESPTAGSITIDQNGNWHYRADAEFNGDDTATIMVDDGNGSEVTSTLSFSVSGYIYEGQDLVITDNSGGDSLVMTGIDAADLSFAQDGDDLAVQVADGATVTLKNYFADTSFGVDKVVTDQGNIHLAKDVINNLQGCTWWAYRPEDKRVSNLITGSNYSDRILGGRKNDVLIGGNGFDNLYGKDGNDTLIGGNRSDYIKGGDGNDALFGDQGRDYLNGGSGHDVLVGGTENDYLDGSKGDDLLFGGTGRDYLNGGKGNDTLNGGEGNDTLIGSDGDDVLYGNEGDDYLEGGSGNDQLHGGEGDDYLKASRGDDHLYGGQGQDYLEGSSGNDVLSGGTGNDTLKGSKGEDIYLFEQGDGQDTIIDSGSKNDDDVIRFADGVSKEDISFFMEDSKLHIQYSDMDAVTIVGQDMERSQIERIELSDGSHMSHDDINLIIQQMSAYATENGFGQMSNSDIRNNEQMMQIITSGWH